MPTKRPERRHCPLCHSVLERQARQLVCVNCLVIWHGDTFEPIPLRTPTIDPLEEYFS